MYLPTSDGPVRKTSQPELLFWAEARNLRWLLKIKWQTFILSPESATTEGEGHGLRLAFFQMWYSKDRM